MNQTGSRFYSIEDESLGMKHFRYVIQQDISNVNIILSTVYSWLGVKRYLDYFNDESKTYNDCHTQCSMM